FCAARRSGPQRPAFLRRAGVRPSIAHSALAVSSTARTKEVDGYADTPRGRTIAYGDRRTAREDSSGAGRFTWRMGNTGDRTTPVVGRLFPGISARRSVPRSSVSSPLEPAGGAGQTVRMDRDHAS